MGWNLRELVTRHNVPGAQVAVLVNGEISDEAAGILSLHTRIETTTDSVFQIGSITKIWTATLAQRMVNSGVLDLDRPVVSYMPDFQLSDPAATDSLTSRHLLTHTGGIDGNLFTGTGVSGDAITKFVATLSGAEQHFPATLLVLRSSASATVTRSSASTTLRSSPSNRTSAPTTPTRSSAATRTAARSSCTTATPATESPDGHRRRHPRRRTLVAAHHRTPHP